MHSDSMSPAAAPFVRRLTPAKHGSNREIDVAFWSDIRQRRLFQIIAAYAAAGWIVLQAVDQLAHNGLLPRLSYPLAFVWYMAGFVATAVVGWFHGERGNQKAPSVEIAILGVLTVGLLAFSAARVSAYLAERTALRAASTSGLDLRRIAVAYFNDVEAGQPNRHIADAFTEELIGELSAVRALDVVSANGVAPFRNFEVPPDSLAALLQAGTVVGGSVEQKHDRLRVNVRLFDGESGAEYRRASFETPAVAVLQTRDELVLATARLLREWLGAEIQLRERVNDTQNPAAWAHVQRAEKVVKDAEALIKQHELTRAVPLFENADSVLSRAEAVDTSWVEPTILRTRLAYRRSRLAHDPGDALRWIEVGLAHAERALERAPHHARALELRGTLRYWRHLLPVPTAERAAEVLVQQARSDLEQAVRRNPELASAYATLSHLYFWLDDLSSGVLAAQRAYEEDAYLETADVVLWRLVTGSYDLEQFESAARWCDEGFRRFPTDYRFSQCQILAMTTRAADADVQAAWRLLSQIDSLAPEGVRPVQRARSLVYLGGVLARSGMTDSADAVLRMAREESRADIDPAREILLNEAAMRANLIKDVDGAIDLLKRYAVANPGYTFEHHWWWRGVRSHPRYAELTLLQGRAR
jgi:TolB-like protein